MPEDFASLRVEIVDFPKGRRLALTKLLSLEDFRSDGNVESLCVNIATEIALELRTAVYADQLARQG